MSRKEITAKLTQAAVMYMTKKGFAVFTEIGVEPWGKRKVDVMAFNLKREIVIFEVKSCRADYQTDTKWRVYLQYSNRMYFVVKEADLEWARELIDKDVGIAYLHSSSGHLRVSRPAQRRSVLGKTKRDMFTRMAYRAAQFSIRNTKRLRIYL